ncbi:MAG: DsbA family protein [Pseudomonadota bacterium]
MPDTRMYHAFRSPFSRLGLHMLINAGVEFELVPIITWPDGMTFSDPVANPIKRDYVAFDAFRMTGRMGLPIALPDPFEVDYTPATRVQAKAREVGKDITFAKAVSDARWGEGKNISDLNVLAECAEATGLPHEIVTEAQTDPAIDTITAEWTALIHQDKPFGVPFAVSGNAKYWGHDRFALLLEDLGLTVKN